MTEDLEDGGLYRYTPSNWPDLSKGRLEIARAEGGEGIWLDGHTLYVSTTMDHRVHAYDTRREHIEVIYDGLATKSAPLLRVDQMTGSRAGEIFVCEDIATAEIDLGVIEADRSVSRLLSVTGPR